MKLLQLFLVPLLLNSPAFSLEPVYVTPSVTPAVATTALSLDQAIAQAVQHNPAVQASREKVNQADSQVSGAYSIIFPQIDGSAAYQIKQDPINNPLALFGGSAYNYYAAQLTLNQPLFSFGQIWGGISYAKTTRSLSETERDIAERDLKLNVVLSFYSVLLYQRQVETLQNNIQVETDQLKTAQYRLKIGRGQLLDVLQIKTQLALLTPKLDAALNQVQVSATQLAYYLGSSNSRELRVKGTLEPTQSYPPAREIRKLSSKVLEAERAGYLIQQQNALKTVTLSKEYPSLNAFGSISRSAFEKSDLLNDDATAYVFGVQLTIPIFSGLSSVYARHALASQVAQAELTQTQALDTVALNQVQTQKNLDLSASTVESSHQAYQIGLDSMKEATRAFSRAQIDYVRFLQSQQDLISAELGFNQAKYDYIANLSKYFVAYGYPMDDLVKILNERKTDL